MDFSVFTELCNYHQNLRTFSTPKQETPCPVAVTPLLTLLSPTTNLCSVSIDFPFLDISYKWNHTMHGPLLSLMFSRFICVVACFST